MSYADDLAAVIATIEAAGYTVQVTPFYGSGKKYAALYQDGRVSGPPSMATTAVTDPDRTRAYRRTAGQLGITVPETATVAEIIAMVPSAFTLAESTSADGWHVSAVFSDGRHDGPRTEAASVIDWYELGAYRALAAALGL